MSLLQAEINKGTRSHNFKRACVWLTTRFLLLIYFDLGLNRIEVQVPSGLFPGEEPQKEMGFCTGEKKKKTAGVV